MSCRTTLTMIASDNSQWTCPICGAVNVDPMHLACNHSYSIENLYFISASCKPRSSILRWAEKIIADDLSSEISRFYKSLIESYYQKTKFDWDWTAFDKLKENMPIFNCRRAVSLAYIARPWLVYQIFCGDNSAMMMFLLGVGYVIASQSKRCRRVALISCLGYSYITRAANLGCLYAQYYLGDINVSSDKATAFHWFVLAANEGMAEAQFRLTLSEFHDLLSPSERFDYMKKAADQGHITCMFHVAVAYRLGTVVDVDLQLSFKYILMGAHCGDAMSLYRAGRCYQEGWGVAKDACQAFRYLKLSADKDNFLADVKVAECYERGKGVEASRENAILYYRKAMLKGSSDARSRLSRFLSQK